MDIKSAHQFCTNNQKAISKSKNCGCFYCLQIFPSCEIKDWCDKDKKVIGQTAICPKCGIDSLIGDLDLNYNKQFLEEMHKEWF